MANLKDLITEGTRQHLEKLTEDELREEQSLALQRFLIVSVKQAAISRELMKRDLEVDIPSMREYIRWVGEQIKNEDNLFDIKGSN